ncbi:uncharacterized protein PHALS_06742 [Plasmopara halstedii]|uniref:Uncharacterized protein n=1 Tax=Plasmopara halstedii TaxID=4781 RepID=A0A0P1B2F6_PLAHL|nr:uncharacterized protein PHALS_06742 [Plasmopara halstedii]CEG48952.1 hypothetical protein PHALS_06742 [Plasmopara halstedii]|eukprot:XP_024585321.1 hypothetical protein PHALS_06742 [Plasmopara halstedii]
MAFLNQNLGMAGRNGDDFNRLYERLVVQRTSIQRQAKRAIHKVSTRAHPEAETQHKASVVAHEFEKIRRQQQQEHDAEVACRMKNLHLARNLRGAAQRIDCSPHHLALVLIDATEKSERLFLKRYQKTKRRRTRRQEALYSKMDRRIRLERIAARYIIIIAAPANLADVMPMGAIPYMLGYSFGEVMFLNPKQLRR